MFLIFYLNSCPFCKKAVDILSQNFNVNYKVINVTDEKSRYADAITALLKVLKSRNKIVDLPSKITWPQIFFIPRGENIDTINIVTNDFKNFTDPVKSSFDIKLYREITYIGGYKELANYTVSKD